MERLQYPMNHEWHVAINRHHDGKMGTPEWKRWMYEAKTMADEVPRMALLFGKERRGELTKTHKQCSMTPAVPVPGNHLRCCLGVKCAECPELLALDKMERATPDDIDTAKAWTCAAHIVSEGGDTMGEGYVLDVSDRMFWDNVYESLSHDDEGANADVTGHCAGIASVVILRYLSPAQCPVDVTVGHHVAGMTIDEALDWADKNSSTEATERLRSRAAAATLAAEVRRLRDICSLACEMIFNGMSDDDITDTLENAKNNL